MKTKIFFEPICKANLKHKGQKNIPQPSKRINEKALYLEKPKLVQAKPRYTFSHCSYQGRSNVIFFGNHGPLTSLPPTISTDEVQD